MRDRDWGAIGLGILGTCLIVMTICMTAMITFATYHAIFDGVAR